MARAHANDIKVRQITPKPDAEPARVVLAPEIAPVQAAATLPHATPDEDTSPGTRNGQASSSPWSTGAGRPIDRGALPSATRPPNTTRKGGGAPPGGKPPERPSRFALYFGVALVSCIASLAGASIWLKRAPETRPEVFTEDTELPIPPVAAEPHAVAPKEVVAPAPVPAPEPPEPATGAEESVKSEPEAANPKPTAPARPAQANAGAIRAPAQRPVHVPPFQLHGERD